MAVRRSILEKKYVFEYDVGMWTFGHLSVVKTRDDGALRTCKTVPKASVWNVEQVHARLDALRELQHPHICSITDVLEDRENFYIISEFCAGGEVAEWMARLDEGYWLQEQTCITYIRHALVALAHSHAARLVHRDLTPSNMQLTSKMPDAEVRVCDVGLASALDPENAIVQRMPTPYTAPEVLESSAPATSAADLWSIGAIAYALLVGHPPPPKENAQSGWMSGLQNQSDDDIWSERSHQSRDFVQRLLRPANERYTAARALQHPWLKGAVIPIGLEASKGAKEARHKTLCYMLAVLLVPVAVPFRDFEKLRNGFARCDRDEDGIISRAMGQRLLLGRCNLREAVDAALDIADVEKSGVLDLCACACADLIAREFFGAGPTSQPLAGPFGAKDLAPRLLKRFFDTFGDRGQNLAMKASIRSKIRTATARDVEQNAGVRYDDILEDLPEDDLIDSRQLAGHLCASGGRGTPLLAEEDLSPLQRSSTTLAWSSPLGFMDFFQTCRAGRREESPHSMNILVR